MNIHIGRISYAASNNTNFLFPFQFYSISHSIPFFQGDSGNALVCRHNDGFGNTWVQAGIASFTSATRPGEIPGIFTRVSAYTTWIENIMAEN